MTSWNRSNKVRLIVHFLWIVTTLVRGSSGQSWDCFHGLGLEDYRIKDDQITANVNTSEAFDATSGRLNNPNGAWCYTSDLFQKVHFTVDLGSEVLITGFQSQGPPLSVHPVHYLRYVGLKVKLSRDGVNWISCCGDNPILFYANDRTTEANEVTSHSFQSAHVARYVRIEPITSVRWVGHDEKCFRFEILGCGIQSGSYSDILVRPFVQFEFDSLPAGFLTSSWTTPKVRIFQGEEIPLEASFFLLNITSRSSSYDSWRDLETFNTSDESLILSRPHWASEYKIDLACEFQEILLDCGSHIAQAIVQANHECFKHSSKCNISSHVRFSMPEKLSSLSAPNGSSIITWSRDSKHGWISSSIRVDITNSDGSKILSVNNEDEAFHTLEIPMLDENQEYELKFFPEGEGIPQDVIGLSAKLVLVKSVDGQGPFSFVASVDLRTHVVWSGQIRCTWTQAIAKMSDGSQLEADGYTLNLRYLGGSNVLQSETAESTVTVSEFGGVNMEESYHIEIFCSFANRTFKCGESILFSSSPVSVKQFGDKAIVYVETTFPDRWSGLESFCQASDGHLVTLSNKDLEQILTENSELETFWTGGNMCPDSPAPSSSLWSSGSGSLTYTNFASNSELDGDHCCIKADFNENRNITEWKGESCSRILKGICEFIIYDYLDEPKNVSAREKSANSVNITWNTDKSHWQPDTYVIEYCHVKSLSSISLPPMDEECQEVQVGNKNSSVSLKDLQPFSEYEVTIRGGIPTFEGEVVAVQSVRTLPENDIEWLITSTGVLRISWLRKVADFMEDDPVQLEIADLLSNETMVFEGNAMEIQAHGFVLGKTYSMKLADYNDPSLTYGPVEIQAYPNCTVGKRYGYKCVSISEKSFAFREAESKCPRSATSQEEVVQFDHAKLDSEYFWIGLGDATDSGMERSSRIYEESENDEDKCDAWMPRSRAFTSVLCNQRLPMICQQNLSVEAGLPDAKSIKISPGPTYMLFDWDVPEEGWVHTFTIWTRFDNETLFDESIDYDVPRRVKRDENGTENGQVLMVTATTTPINVTGLSPETKYDFLIETKLNEEWKEILAVEDVFTTANDSRLPENIIGYTAIQEYKTAQVSLISIIIAIILIAIIIFLISGTLSVYTDNAVQLCFEVCLIGFLVSYLLALPDAPLGWDIEDPTLCALASAFMAFFTVAAFTFLFLESLVIAHHLVAKKFVCSISDKSWLLVSIGIAVPFVYTAIAVPVLYKDLIPVDNKVCWLNLDNATAATFLIPIILLFCLTCILLTISIFGSQEERAMSASYTLRTSTMRFTRYVTLLIVLMFGVSWALGITSAHYGRGELVVVYLIALFGLAIVILALRCLMDKQVRMRLKRFGKSNEELGIPYHRSRSAKQSASRRSVFSAQSRHSVVAPEKMTPVESRHSGENEDFEDTRVEAEEGSGQRQNSVISKSSSALLTSQSLTMKSNYHALLNLCGWNHSENAIWKELERNSPRSAENRKALRQFRRICTESYMPVLSGKVSPQQSEQQIQASSHSSHSTSSSSSSTTSSDPNSPAKYVSPFGEEPVNAHPVAPGPTGDIIKVSTATGVALPVLPTLRPKSRNPRSAETVVSSEAVLRASRTRIKIRSKSDKDFAPSATPSNCCQVNKAYNPLEDDPTYFSLPNTPDTEDPLRQWRNVEGRPVLQLLSHIGGESYI